ncbi:MAG: (deoxy)nucleoside triphosphate pyrophosphohydrolase [Candidatus Thermoplasmatota archaeon]|nr:(deoxy)nucleoside triphosphate pyrophosphohydrolase [Candidatus Thermoplasmatota archaeon]
MDDIENVVTAAIIRKDTKILIAQRNNDSYLEPNKWEFPGGKVEQNETYEECLIREIHEELDIQISIDSLFLVTKHVYVKEHRKIPILLVVYLTDWVDGMVQPIECQDARWIDVHDIRSYDFAEADMPVVMKLVDGAQ